MHSFLGRYEYQLDPKGRVSLPAAFRREAAEERFVLAQVHAPALTLYPQSTWEGVVERLLELKRRQPEARDYVVWVASSAVEVVPDKQGRILIPAWMHEAAKLDGRVLLVGALDRIELWTPALFETSVREGARRFEQFTAQIFA
ncbi:MAG: cell division/cell wall cluster transcriptional repressor MraZ [Gemmatimonadetes bacterium]|nr:cell division/cell wall cluster transcriptional repressor MraZ [Gemmatimonadota bacterium]